MCDRSGDHVEEGFQLPAFGRETLAWDGSLNPKLLKPVIICHRGADLASLPYYTWLSPRATIVYYTEHATYVTAGRARFPSWPTQCGWAIIILIYLPFHYFAIELEHSTEAKLRLTCGDRGICIVDEDYYVSTGVVIGTI